jgi:hypothetical protein
MVDLPLSGLDMVPIIAPEHWPKPEPLWRGQDAIP